MSIIIFLSSIITSIMWIWFKTDAVVEWARVFGFRKLYTSFKYAKIDAAPQLLTFPQYLKGIKDCFATRLLSCPSCLCAWLSIAFCLLLSLLGLGISTLFYIPISYISSLIIYGIMTKLYH